MKQVKIKTRLKSSTIDLEGVESFVGKEVEIIISEAQDINAKKVWKSAGTVNLKGKLDNLNIRDYAHD